ncbi:MAG TPA: ABC transporter permease [Candidatus Limnocylindrales bacterium]|jgi:peptide/nickel transport system permease protein|nr:ABC transporter permease [Candidatus Limnocylindrales bacterium]
MVGFLGRRLAYNALVLVGVAFVVYALVLLTSDPARALLPPTTPPEVIESFRRAHGYDRPFVVQFALFLSRAVVGDFGNSIRYGEPALGVVLERVPATLALSITGLAIALAIAVPLGVAAAMREGTWIDGVARGVIVTGSAVPNFVVAQVLILVVAVGIRALPVSGAGTPAHLVLPGLVVGLASSAGLVRILRSSLLDVFGREYIRTAYGKGLGERAVVIRHAIRNAAIPVVTFLAFDVASILSGVVIVERVFAYPGMGLLATQAVTNRDLPLIQAFVFVSALTIVTANVLLDVVYVALDPRIRVR